MKASRRCGCYFSLSKREDPFPDRTRTRAQRKGPQAGHDAVTAFLVEQNLKARSTTEQEHGLQKGSTQTLGWGRRNPHAMTARCGCGAWPYALQSYPPAACARVVASGEAARERQELPPRSQLAARVCRAGGSRAPQTISRSSIAAK
eukprot:scaffold1365_cov121-Isochrysis_galbana.AAC.9